jgi:hypothetical protein
MKRNRLRGISTFEFAMSLMVLVPLVLGTGAIGINLIRTMQTVQLARDAGHMYAKGVDFSATNGAGNRSILADLGTGMGLSATTGSGKAVVILSALTYVDGNTCAAGDIANGNAAPGSQTCTNLGKWVFVQRLLIGNNTLRTSNYGAPITNGADIPNNVTLDSNGMISIGQYTTRTGAVAQFTAASGINPYTVSAGGAVSGLPSGQRLYLSEAAGPGYGMPPFVAGAPTYSYAFF